MFYYKNLQLYFKLGLKIEASTSFIRISSIKMTKTIYQVQYTKNNRGRKKMETKIQKHSKNL